MSKTTTNNYNPAHVLTSEQLSDVSAALSILHSIVGGDAHRREKEEALPPFEKCGAEEQRRILARTYDAIGATVAADAENRRKAFLDKITGAMNTHIEAHRAAVKAFSAEMEKMSPVMRQIITSSGKVPDPNVVKVPLSHITACFKEGATSEQIVKKLTTFGFTVRGKGDDAHVRLQLETK